MSEPKVGRGGTGRSETVGDRHHREKMARALYLARAEEECVHQLGRHLTLAELEEAIDLYPAQR